MNYDSARGMAISLLKDRRPISPDLIKESLDNLSIFWERMGFSEIDLGQLESDLTTHFNIVTQDYSILEDPSRVRPWLNDARAEIQWRFWSRYKDYLQLDKNLAHESVRQLDSLTDDVLDRIGNPKSGQAFDRRGMVVGHVQSGKTGNYTGLICKTADAGYRLIIVLAGIHSSLRSQTQQRIDEGFLGFSTDTERNFARATSRIGAGIRVSDVPANSLTSSREDGDFKRSTAQNLGVPIRSNDPIVAVVKKNSSILKNLIRWLYSHADTIEGDTRIFWKLPLLLIDDEADNATINTSIENVSAINGNIRALLSLFEQKAYVGYTATPFANIYIPYQNDNIPNGLNINVGGVAIGVQEDLFPRDFIVNIPAPSNYIGPDKVFGLGEATPLQDEDSLQSGSTVLPVIRVIDDYPEIIPDRHKRAYTPPSILPRSLERAVRAFILASASRQARGQSGFHSSMLVHVTRFTNWQDAIGELVDDLLRGYRDLIAAGSADLISRLQTEWEQDFETTTRRYLDGTVAYEDPSITALTWRQVREQLYTTIARMVVKVVHGPGEGALAGLASPLDYQDHENGLLVIAVGGDKLSRGLTLEGLCVSYFLRASKMYDTLMQMGRWFGYRPGYADLCRLFTSQELVDWYRHIAIASDEMRQQFDQMALEGRTPRDYGLKVRSLPGILQITAINKLRFADEIELSYSDTLLETYAFSKDQRVYDRNYDAVLSLLNGLGTSARSDLHYIWKGISPSHVIQFLRQYRPHKDQQPLNAEKLTDYIQQQVDNRTLTTWDVVLINTKAKAEDKNVVFNLPVGDTRYDVNATIRNTDDKASAESYKIKKGHILSPSHEALDLMDAERQEAYQQSLAIAQGKWDKENEKKVRQGSSMDKPRPESIATLSGVAVRAVRPAVRGLLLLYPLSPFEVKRSEGEPAFDNSHPLMGYAISFPKIDSDRKVKYMANAQYLEEYEYPGELDDQPEEEA